MFKNFIINKIRVGYTLKLSEVQSLHLILILKDFLMMIIWDPKIIKLIFY